MRSRLLRPRHPRAGVAVAVLLACGLAPAWASAQQGAGAAGAGSAEGEGGAAPPRPTAVHHVLVGAGLPGLLDAAESTAGLLAVRFATPALPLRPMAGVVASSQRQIFLFAGIYREVTLGRLFLTPLFSAGVWENGGGRNLGSPFQFRSALEVAWQLDLGYRVGVELAHVSNGGFRRPNPGEERLLLTVALPFS
ncbi:MAG: acyloxyacyl hydrolase [Longimicrobiales bacterium]|nr:acyloxyacyl hydrolase [Longimicrobiales bacterium]